MKQTLKKNLFGYITIALCAGIMIYFVLSTGGFLELANLFGQLRARWLWFALAAAAMVWIMEAAAFHAVATHIYDGWKFSRSFVSAMVGLLYCAITPFSTGGQPMQIYSLHKHGMTTGAATAAVTVRSITYQLGLVAFSLLMVVLRLTYFTQNVSGFTWLLLLGLATSLGYVTFLFLVMKSPKTTDKLVRFFVKLLTKLHIFKNPEERYEKIHTELNVFHENVKMLGRSVKMYALSLFFSFCQFIFQCLIPYFLYVACFHDKAIFVKEDILTVMAAQAFVLMVSYFVPTPGASGGAEVSYYGFFGGFYNKILHDASARGTLSNAGVPYTEVQLNEMATSKLSGTMFLWRFITYYFTIIAGSVFVSISNRLTPLKVKNRLFDEEEMEHAHDEKRA